MLNLYAFYAARGIPLDTLAAYTSSELAFLTGARALYEEEQVCLMQAAVVRAFDGGGEQ